MLTKEQKKQGLEAVEAMRRRRELSDAEADAKIEQLGLRDAIDAGHGIVKQSDREIAAQVLVANGVAPDEAWRRVAVAPDSVLAEHADAIAARRATLQNLADDQARHAFEQSEEGRRLRAAELADRDAQIERDVALADRLIVADGIATPAMLAEMPAEERVALAFGNTQDDSPIAAIPSVARRSKWAGAPSPSESELDANRRAAGTEESS